MGWSGPAAGADRSWPPDCNPPGPYGDGLGLHFPGSPRIRRTKGPGFAIISRCSLTSRSRVGPWSGHLPRPGRTRTWRTEAGTVGLVARGISFSRRGGLASRVPLVALATSADWPRTLVGRPTSGTRRRLAWRGGSGGFGGRHAGRSRPPGDGPVTGIGFGRRAGILAADRVDISGLRAV